jgi:hypothetical protein
MAVVVDVSAMVCSKRVIEEQRWWREAADNVVSAGVHRRRKL